MNTRNSTAQAGFTMVEMMTALAIVALLAALAVPTMRNVIQNGRIRAASTSIQNGLQLARAEAVRLNTQVEFVLAANGWQVRRIGGAALHQADRRDIPAGMDIDVLPVGATRITYNSFGLTATTNPSDGSARITRLDLGVVNPMSSPDYKPLAIQLTGGGVPRLCDPGVASTNPKACL